MHHDELLRAAVENWWILIERWSTSGLLSWAAKQAWGNSADLDAIRQLEEQAAKGNKRWLPVVAVSNIEIAEPRQAFYQVESKTIAVNITWLEKASKTDIIGEITRELGRYFSKSITQSGTEREIDVFTNILTSSKYFEQETAKSSGSGEMDPIQEVNTHSLAYAQSKNNSSASNSKTASTIYVSTDGNDTNSGGLSTPFRTIQHAINNAQAGDVISIRGGTYRERLKIEELNGHENAPITFVNYQNEVKKVISL